MNYLYVANWKMNLSFNESINFCTDNIEQLNKLSSTADIVICPSFVVLSPIAQILKNTTIALGAQNCSEHASGSYTGEVSAQSLAEVDVAYCIVGHSELRMRHDENTTMLIKKIDLLYQNNITPIICVGETKEDFLHKKTLDTLTEQLELILKTIVYQKYNHVIIAYEPFWAIGTGIVPENLYLEKVFGWLEQFVNSYASNCTKQLLYGGNVNSTNIDQFKNIPNIDGFLIGRASTDFEELSKIIEISNNI